KADRSLSAIKKSWASFHMRQIRWYREISLVLLRMGVFYFRNRKSSVLSSSYSEELTVRRSLLGQGHRHSYLIRESVIFGTFISSCRRKWFVMKQKVVFIGAGSMAEAIIAGLVQAQFFPNEYIFVTNKNDRSRL